MITKRYIFFALSFFVAVYFFGIATGHYKFFPFNILFSLKSQVINNSGDKRNFETGNLEEQNVPIDSKTGIYLTYGQSNAANHGQIGYEVRQGVYQYHDGKTYIYKDPSLGATGDDGSVWGMVGEKLIKSGLHKQVIFSNSGYGGRRIEDLNKDPYLNHLIKNHDQLVKDYGRVDAILYHQGEINHSNKYGNSNYYEDFKILVDNLKARGITIPIYLSRTSICENDSDATLLEIQNKIIQDMDIVFPGPNTDLLSEKKYRLPDNCHFSTLGFEKFSDMWVMALNNEI
ncbi:sialate O-acetylesterase [Gillisia sp. Q332]|uniref:sialate O-acetylesterase n=1 Tax=Gillisia xinjiangensis TaxID=3384765 RepID=UPI00391B6EF2